LQHIFYQYLAVIKFARQAGRCRSPLARTAPAPGPAPCEQLHGKLLAWGTLLTQNLDRGAYLFEVLAVVQQVNLPSWDVLAAPDPMLLPRDEKKHNT
jgi:hypothetical protein